MDKSRKEELERELIYLRKMESKLPIRIFFLKIDLLSH